MTYTHDYDAFGDLVLRAPFMVAEMEHRAHAVMDAAVADAPFDPDSTDGTHYRDSFHVSSTDHGGVKHDRAEGTVTNDDPAALYIEYGTSDTPKHRTLGRALDAAHD